MLLVVDFQETLFEKCLQRDEVERKAVKLIRAARLLGLPIVVTEQYPKGLGPTSPGIAEALASFEAIPKTSFSCTREIAVEAAFEKANRRNIILCGIEAHICIYQTARDLVDQGQPVQVPGDAVTSRAEFDLHVALGRMRSEGVIVSSTEMIIYELLRCSGTEDFKKLLPLLKDGVSPDGVS